MEPVQQQLQPQPQQVNNTQGLINQTPTSARDKTKVFIDNLKLKFNALPKNTRILVVFIVALFFIIFALSILVALFGKKQNRPVLLPSPSPISVTPAPNVILNASRYATDSGVLKIEDDLKNFQKQLDTSDVKQTDLSAPNLDFNINFQR